MGTVTIPLTTLQTGTREFGPANIQDGDSLIVLTIDRTVASGMNATPDAVIELETMVSLDGGTSWTLAVGCTWPGGEILNPPPPKSDGLPMPSMAARVGLDQFPGSGRRIKAVMTVSGSPVAVAGTLTTS